MASTSSLPAGSASQETGSGAPARLRLLVVDDHALVRAGVRAELTSHAADLEVVAEADDVEGAIAAVHALAPDVVLLDVHLPGGNGGGGTEVVASCHDVPATRFLALSVSDASEDVVGVIRAGARGYVTKAISTADLAQAVRRVAAGDAAFSPRLAGFVLDAFGAGTGEVAVADSELDRLSAREREVMRLHLQGVCLRALHLGQDGGDTRIRCAAQASTVQPQRAHSLGRRAAHRVRRSPGVSRIVGG